MDTIAVIDFETTGLSPEQGARATEIAAVLVRDGRIVGRYQSLMNAGVWIPPFIESFTGITNAMVQGAPPAARVMREVAEFVGGHPLVAHNAAFDRKFWDAELGKVRLQRSQAFACSMLVARRVFPRAPDHKLGTLVAYAKLPVAGRFHRAMADAEMTADLVLEIERDLIRRFRVRELTHEMLRGIQRIPARQLDAYFERLDGCFRHGRQSVCELDVTPRGETPAAGRS